MDQETLKRQIEKVFARQTGLSPKTKERVAQKLGSLDWDEFKDSVLSRYYVEIEKVPESPSPAICNQLLMEAIRSELEERFGLPNVGPQEE